MPITMMAVAMMIVIMIMTWTLVSPRIMFMMEMTTVEHCFRIRLWPDDATEIRCGQPFPEQGGLQDYDELEAEERERSSGA